MQSMVAHIILSGMIAYGPSPEKSEAVAFLANDSIQGGHHDVFHKQALEHEPSFHFDCNDLVEIGEVERGEDGFKLISSNQIPADVCRILFPNVFSSQLNNVAKRFDLSQGFDVYVLPNSKLPRGYLKYLDCNSDSDKMYCECPQGPAKKLCSFSALVPMIKIQPGSEKLKYELFNFGLDGSARAMAVARVMMTVGRVGADLENSPVWDFSIPILKTNPKGKQYIDSWRPVKDITIPANVRWDVDVQVPDPAKSSLDVVFVKVGGNRGTIMRFKFGGGNLSLAIVNEPTYDSFCSNAATAASDHFPMLLSLSGREVPTWRTIPRSKDNPEEYCLKKKSEVLAEQSSGKYPVVCLSPTMEGYAIQAPTQGIIQ